MEIHESVEVEDDFQSPALSPNNIGSRTESLPESILRVGGSFSCSFLCLQALK